MTDALTFPDEEPPAVCVAAARPSNPAVTLLAKMVIFLALFIGLESSVVMKRNDFSTKGGARAPGVLDARIPENEEY
jgi:hypothetical protein